MNWGKFKDAVSHTCLAGAVVVSWSLTQEIAGSGPFTVLITILVTEFSKSSENIYRKECIPVGCVPLAC